MSLLTGVHGTVATVFICALLFIDEAGVPLPFAPNELLLIVAGLLMATGGLSPFEFYPVALIAMGGGTLSGYSWARHIGPRQLRAVAQRLRGGRIYDRVVRRMEHAGPWNIGVARMLPGVRVYTTLVCGASGVSLRTFAAGAIPATVVWCAVCTTLGVVVGVPAEHLFTQLQRLLFTGAVFLALGFFGVLAARHVPSSEPRVEALREVPRAGRVLLAIGVDFGVVASFVAGIDRITHFILHEPEGQTKYDFGILAGVVAVAYLLASRRIPGVTAGEGLFNIAYQTVPLHWHPHVHRHPRRGPDTHIHIHPLGTDPHEAVADRVTTSTAPPPGPPPP